MASLIGNIVILLVVIIVFQRMVGSNSTMNDKARDVLKIIDANLGEKQTKKNKRKNFKDYCTAKDFLLAASIIRHQDSEEAGWLYQRHRAGDRNYPRQGAGAHRYAATRRESEGGAGWCGVRNQENRVRCQNPD